MNLIEFIEESNTCSEVQILTQKFLHFLGQFGFNQFVMSEMSHDTTNQKESHHGILVNYPKEWMDHYVTKHYIEHDPVYQAALTARKPFTWKSATESPGTSSMGKKVMDEAQECKLYDGVALAIHQPLGQIIGMGFSGSNQGIDIDKTIISMVFAAAHQFFMVYADLTEWNKLPDVDPGLTPREREIILWLARGKNRGDIAEIINVSESTINRHCENIFLKLSVNNVTLAAAKAIRMGLINPY